MKPACWKCSQPLDLPPGPLSFRANCDHCGSWLHACINCKNYRPQSGLPNDCLISGTDFVKDRQGSNFCDEFSLLGIKTDKEGPSKEKFNSLFKD